MPLTKAVGINTALSTSAIAMTAPLTSSIARWVASTGESPSAMCRSTFSTTTIASSTTIPIASTSPNSERLLIENPKADMAANVPMSDTGTEIRGISEDRQFCRKSTTTNMTRMTAMIRVSITARMDSRMKAEVS
jgi:hypothetical protein